MSGGSGKHLGTVGVAQNHESLRLVTHVNNSSHIQQQHKRGDVSNKSNPTFVNDDKDSSYDNMLDAVKHSKDGAIIDASKPISSKKNLDVRNYFCYFICL